MPESTRHYYHVVFTPEVIEEAKSVLERTLPEGQKEAGYVYRKIVLSLEEEWSHDTDEEFFADYRKEFQGATFQKCYGVSENGVSQSRMYVYVDRYFEDTQRTQVTLKMRSRVELERVFGIFEANVEKCRLPEPPKPTTKKKIFIGHGHNAQWRNLKDHLHEKHGLDVEAYELGTRAGLTIKEVFDEMLTSSSFALLVLTGEDLDASGDFHARENVTHELGLFQGRLGWRKAIILLEEGVAEFSNIHGLNQIRFSKGNIEATYGEVLATIRREFQEKE